MALNKMKKLIEDLEQGSTLVMSNPVAKATSAGYGGTAYLSATATAATLATSAAYAGTAAKATSAGNAGTARIAQWGSAGTGSLA